ncbi:DUF6191 domain-containing protein [Streptomyces cuspidosporus]|uniref:Uncharacterized protein n=1 Tax=Streptomyces cuspidosporus TaxID=66882 RepID=A0ABN3FA74_9ACTN
MTEQHTSGPISATGFEQLRASPSPGKQNELEERQSALVMPDSEDDGAPPNRTTVNLAPVTAVAGLRRVLGRIPPPERSDATSGVASASG